MKMDYETIRKLEQKFYSNTFGRLPLALERGEGMYLFDFGGRRYLDMFSGIAVNCLGHAHPAVLEAIKRQSGKLMHVSNWYYTLPQVELAQMLTKLTGMEKAFFTNSGTEAVEAAIKLVRARTGKKQIIAMKGAFHGRSLGALSLTWESKYRKPFEPLIPGMRFAKYNDLDSLKNNISEDTAAVILEPVLGEAGVIIPDADYLKAVRELTEEKNILLIVDEVQTGFGRTGVLFAYQKSGITPDILCLAKGLGSGFPIGAMLSSGVDFKPGEHGGTFIGNPLACEVAKAVIKTIIEDNLVGNSEQIGSYLIEKLKDGGFDVWGRGLMIGVGVPNGEKKVLSLIDKGVLSIHSGNTVRILPPLIIGKKHADELLSLF
ncbi:MAG: aspartate aminotransferase family protein [Candidatus Altiarchaeales archaeon ex4484_96]|nr:MAG: aspartate aminotransferase family protein [Candidatus Altiarchaeales archaeon ex4484_96]